MRLAALLLALMTASAHAEVSSGDLLLAARCIGEQEAALSSADHIVSDPGMAERLRIGFDKLTAQPQSPPMSAMEQARRAGFGDAASSSGPFEPVETIMSRARLDGRCLEVLDKVGLLAEIYPD